MNKVMVTANNPTTLRLFISALSKRKAFNLPIIVLGELKPLGDVEGVEELGDLRYCYELQGLGLFSVNRLRALARHLGVKIIKVKMQEL